MRSAGATSTRSATSTTPSPSTYLEEVRDEWLAGVLATATVWEFVLARVAIDFRRELVQDDDEIVAACRLERIGRSSVTHARGRCGWRPTGRSRPSPRAVLVARDRESGASRPLTDAERAAFERERSG